MLCSMSFMFLIYLCRLLKRAGRLKMPFFFLAFFCRGGGHMNVYDVSKIKGQNGLPILLAECGLFFQVL